MHRAGLSTGEAGVLCSVNPDTVLKWIKKGRLAATRTAGGHYRIDEEDLAAFLPAQTKVRMAGATPLASALKPLHCWEYLSRPGVIRDECRRCVVYQIRAAWCYRVATSMGCETGQRTSACANSCEDCTYYRRASGQATNVLVISSDEQFVDELSAGDDALAVRFATNAYRASAMIGTFHAAFVVVDQDLVAGDGGDLLDCLEADARLPGVRIILAVPRGAGARSRAAFANGVVGAIEKPFGQARILEVVNRFPVEPAFLSDKRCS